MAKEENKEPKKIKVAAVEATTIDGVRLEKDQEMEVTPQQYAALAARLKKVAAGLVLLAALFLGINAHAQQYSAAALQQTNSALGFLDGVNTNAIVKTVGATNLMITIPQAAKYGDIGIQWTFSLVSAGTTASTACFDASADGVYWTPSYAVLTVTPSGTTTVGTYSNITLNSIGYLRLSYITNGNTPVMTNVSVKAVYKPSRYGN